MQTAATNTRGHLPDRLSIPIIKNPFARPGLVQKELSKSTHTRVHLLEGGYVLRSYLPEVRGPLVANVIEVFDMQAEVGDHPRIETPIYAYQGEGEELLLSEYREVRSNIVLRPTTLNKILGALLHMDIKGVMHGDLGDFNVGEDHNGDPFIYDFDKARKINWNKLDIHPEVIAFFFLNPSSTVQSEPFNIDLFQNFILFDQFVVLEEEGKSDEARGLYKLFLQHSIGYFLKLKDTLSLSPIYSTAIDKRIAAIKKLLNNPLLLQSIYDDKMLSTFTVAHSWATREVGINGRTELVEYRDLAKRRMETWILRRSLL